MSVKEREGGGARRGRIEGEAARREEREVRLKHIERELGKERGKKRERKEKERVRR